MDDIDQLEDMIDSALQELHERRRLRAYRALEELKYRWARGHQKSCLCRYRGEMSCKELRQICCKGGLWKEVNNE